MMALRYGLGNRRFLMALTLQRKLELAGDVSRVQPLLQRLHIVEKPKSATLCAT